MCEITSINMRTGDGKLYSVAKINAASPALLQSEDGTTAFWVTSIEFDKKTSIYTIWGLVLGELSVAYIKAGGSITYDLVSSDLMHMRYWDEKTEESSFEILGGAWGIAAKRLKPHLR